MNSPASTAPGSLVLDLVEGRVWINDRPVELRPKTWQVLRVLVERSGPPRHEGRTARPGLGRHRRQRRYAQQVHRGVEGRPGRPGPTPRFLETVPRRGFRWVGNARIVEAGSPGDGAAPGALPAGRTEARPADTAATSSAVIARDEELARLEACLSRARSGRRQVVFVTGEAGAGKTTLVDRFLDGLEGAGTDAAVLVAHGQCVETSGPSEPYLPLLDAFERLARDRGAGRSVADVLGRCAPTWIAQMASLAPSGSATAVAPTAAPGRMLRELADRGGGDREPFHAGARARGRALGRPRDHRRLQHAREAARRRPPAAAGDDARRRGGRARASGRGPSPRPGLAPGGGGDRAGPVRNGCVVGVPRRALPGLDAHREIAEWLLQQTAGNPLFVRLVVDEWVARGLVAASGDGRWAPTADRDELRLTVPDSLRALLERQIGQLAPGGARGDRGGQRAHRRILRGVDRGRRGRGPRGSGESLRAHRQPRAAVARMRPRRGGRRQAGGAVRVPALERAAGRRGRVAVVAPAAAAPGGRRAAGTRVRGPCRRGVVAAGGPLRGGR